MKSLINNRKSILIISSIIFLILGLTIRISYNLSESLGIVGMFLLFIVFETSVLLFVNFRTITIYEKIFKSKYKLLPLVIIAFVLYFLPYFVTWREITSETLGIYLKYRLTFLGLRNFLSFIEYYTFTENILRFLYVLISSFSFYLTMVFMFIVSKKSVNLNQEKNSKVENFKGDSIMSSQYCQNCGNKLEIGTKFCPSCGTAVTSILSSSGTVYQQQNKTNPNDMNSTGFNVLGFFIPLVGLILYLIWKDEYPIKSKGIGKWALIGFILGIIFSVIYYISVMSVIYSYY